MKSRTRGRVPVVAAGQAARVVHPLLHDGPVAIRGDDERVQVDLEAVGNGVVVDPRREPAGPHQRVAVEPDASRRSSRSSPGVFARLPARGRRRCRCRARRRVDSVPS